MNNNFCEISTDKTMIHTGFTLKERGYCRISVGIEGYTHITFETELNNETLHIESKIILNPEDGTKFINLLKSTRMKAKLLRRERK